MLRKFSLFTFSAILGLASIMPGYANIMDPGSLGPLDVPMPVLRSTPLPALRGTMPQPEPTNLHILPKAPALAPLGYVVFCANNPSQCNARPGVSQVWLYDSQYRTLDKINRLVNHQIRYQPDPASNAFGDVWTIATRSGDCEDYALAKRDLLIKKGWPASAMRLATANTYRGEGHAVLIISTNKGDYVLDNRSDSIKRWNQTDLIWDKIQSASNPQRWYSV